MEFILFFAVFLFLLISFNKWNLLKFEEISPLTLQLIFLIKLGIVFFGIYFFSNYKGYGESSDIYSFFNAAIKTSKTISIIDQLKIICHISPSNAAISYLDHLTYWRKDFDYGLPNDNQTMIKFSLFLSVIGINNYPTHALISTYLGYLGILIIFKSLYNSSKKTLFNLLFITLSPTLLFFSSGIYKESLLILYIGVLVKIVTSNQKFTYLIAFLFVYYLFPIKPYFFIIITPSILVLLFSKYFNLRKPFLIQCIVYLGLFFTFTIYSSIQEKKIAKDDVKYGKIFDPIKMMTYKQDDFLDDGLEKSSKMNKTLMVLEKNNTNIYKAIPIGFFSGWLHPSIFNVFKKIFLPFAVEYTIIFTLMLIFVIQTVQKKIIFNSETAFVLTICIVYSTFIGITSPIIGNLIRFKTPIMPFFYYLISLIQFKRSL